MNQVAIVTGGTSGIGLAAAEELQKAGYQVYTFSRRGGENKGNIRNLAVDVTNEEAVKAAVHEILEEAGKVDLVVNCAGFGISGAIEFTSLEDAKRLFDVDFFGTVNVNNALIGSMRKAGGGRIINISSVAGPAAIPFQAYYSCAKAAVDDYTAAAREKKHIGNDIYGGRIDKSVAKMEKDEVTGASPKVLGRYVVKVARVPNPKPFYTPGIVYKACVVLIKILPCRLVNALIGKLYVVE